MRKQARKLILALYRMDEAYYLNENKKKLSDVELFVMYALDDGKPHSQREISQDLLVPKTSVNTIVKRWEKEGLLTMTPIPGKRREMNIMLTEADKIYAGNLMGFLYRAEEKALKATIEHYSDQFVEAVEFFAKSLKEAFKVESGQGDADDESLRCLSPEVKENRKKETERMNIYSRGKRIRRLGIRLSSVFFRTCFLDILIRADGKPKFAMC